MRSAPAHLPTVTEAPRSIQIALIALAGTSLLLGLAPQLPAQLVAPVASLIFAPQAGDPAALLAMRVSWPVYVLVPVFGAALPALFRRDRIKAGKASAGVLLLSALLVVVFGRQLDTLSFCFALLVPLLGALNMVYALATWNTATGSGASTARLPACVAASWAWPPVSTY